MSRKIAILGSTGSIGRQALEVIREFPGSLEAEVLTAQNNWELLVRQAMEFRPNVVVISREKYYRSVQEALHPLGIKVFTGDESLAQVVTMDSIDLVLNSLVGYSGFKPAVQSILAAKMLALANKESLVVGGELLTGLLSRSTAKLIPVDSEHSAIFQCLAGEKMSSVEKIFLTASGGPFLDQGLDFLAGVRKEDALKHPNWDMGDKITIDSASLMNKGLEVIEARWLFDLLPDRIEVIIHPQSVIHSMVQFTDGSIKAQLGPPDMRFPISYALGYPERLSTNFRRFSIADYPQLTFQKPDLEIFRNLALAYKALEMKGNACCVLNASNEEAVRAFLGNRLAFLAIPKVVEKCLDKMPWINSPTLDDLEQTDREAREMASRIIIEMTK